MSASIDKMDQIMAKRYLFFIFLLLTSVGFGQTITLQGKIVDEDGKAIPKAIYYLKSTPTKKYTTNSEGEYSISLAPTTSDSLHVSLFGFQSTNLAISPKLLKRAKNGVLIMDLTLPYKTFNVFEVYANRPDTVYGTQDYSVADYEFDKAGNLLLLTYDKSLKQGSVLRLLDSSKQITDTYYIQGEAIELTNDFRKNIHLITEEQVFFIDIKQGKMYVYLENRDHYFRNVAPIIDTIGDFIYYSNYSEIYPAFDYLEYNRKDSSNKILLKVEDELMMELYRSEFKYVDTRTKLWAHEKQIETGIDKEIWVGATVFTNSIYYEPLYSPLFKVGNDSIFVFDHYKNLLFKYTQQAGCVDSLPIFYHLDARKSGWQQPLIQDRVTQKIYGIFMQNGFTYLNEINPMTGEISKSFKLNFKYIEHIHLVGDYVYYVYRPYESVQKKYIYREKLKFDE